MLEGLRSYFLNRDEPYRSVHGNVEQCVRVESVDLDVSGEDHEIVILMRDLKRPECVFGRRQPAVEPGDFEEALRHFDSLRDAAEICVTISWAGIEGVHTRRHQLVLIGPFHLLSLGPSMSRWRAASSALLRP